MGQSEEKDLKNEKKEDEQTEEVVKEEKENEASEEVKEDEKEESKKEESPIEKLEKELQSQKEKYVRLYAEYDNYRKRTQNEKLSIYNDATKMAVSEILPMADSINMAVSSLKEDVSDEYRKGIELIGEQLKKSFEKLGVESFGEVGDAFDPELHNAVAKIEDENLDENTISAVYQKGFKIKDKIIREAMVQVANCD